MIGSCYVYQKIKAIPLSVNNARQGRRFKTTAYKEYRESIAKKLIYQNIPDGVPLAVTIIRGFSNKASDIDNPLKPFLDCLQDKYGINDKNIYKLEIVKKIVPNGEEFIEFDIRKI